jgi:hypothetical protein
MPQTYSDGKYIYSVDMIFSYIHNHTMITEKLKTVDLYKQLSFDCWGDPITKVKYTPLDVINNPKKYPDEYKKILNANLKYPIIMTHDLIIVDGMHRLAKTYIKKKKYINVYIFDKELMKKFIVGKNNEWDKVDNMKIYDIIDLYVKRFHN